MKTDSNRRIEDIPEINDLDLCVVTVTGEGDSLVSLKHRVIIAGPDDDDTGLAVYCAHKYVEITPNVEAVIWREVHGETGTDKELAEYGFPGWDEIFVWIEKNPNCFLPTN